MFQIMLQYNVADFRNSLEFLTLLAKRRGYLKKGGLPNTEEAAVAFLTDCTGLVFKGLVVFSSCDVEMRTKCFPRCHYEDF